MNKNLYKKFIKTSQVENFRTGSINLASALQIKVSVHEIEQHKYIFGLFSYSTIVIYVEGSQLECELFFNTKI
jgi:hypothetical protein